jgi:hypothetical protein
LSCEQTPQGFPARRLFSQFANSDSGAAAVDIARRPGLNSSVVSCAARQGIDMAQQNEYALLNKNITE